MYMEYKRYTRRVEIIGNISVGEKKTGIQVKHMKAFIRGTHREENLKSHRDARKSRTLKIKQETQEVNIVRNPKFINLT